MLVVVLIYVLAMCTHVFLNVSWKYKHPEIDRYIINHTCIYIGILKLLQQSPTPGNKSATFKLIEEDGCDPAIDE